MKFTSPPTSAVILAAGMGVRLRALQSELPKGLITLGGVSLVPRSIELLLAEGVTDLVLVTGWRAEAYEKFLAAHFPRVRCVHNPDFATTGSMHSLYLAREAGIAGDFLLLESDLLYEPRALRELRAAPRGDYVLLSGTTGQGDEVFAYARDGRLAALSKQRRADEPAAGEFTGIGRVTADFFTKLCTHFEARGTLAAGNYHYDDAFTALAATHPIQLLTIEDLVWCEIDDPAHHARALQRVLPQLSKISHDGAA